MLDMSQIGWRGGGRLIGQGGYVPISIYNSFGILSHWKNNFCSVSNHGLILRSPNLKYFLPLCIPNIGRGHSRSRLPWRNTSCATSSRCHTSFHKFVQNVSLGCLECCVLYLYCIHVIRFIIVHQINGFSLYKSDAGLFLFPPKISHPIQVYSTIKILVGKLLLLHDVIVTASVHYILYFLTVQEYTL